MILKKHPLFVTTQNPFHSGKTSITLLDNYDIVMKTHKLILDFPIPRHPLTGETMPGGPCSYVGTGTFGMVADAYAEIKWTHGVPVEIVCYTQRKK